MGYEEVGFRAGADGKVSILGRYDPFEGKVCDCSAEGTSSFEVQFDTLFVGDHSKQADTFPGGCGVIASVIVGGDELSEGFASHVIADEESALGFRGGRFDENETFDVDEGADGERDFGACDAHACPCVSRGDRLTVSAGGLQDECGLAIGAGIGDKFDGRVDGFGQTMVAVPTGSSPLGEIMEGGTWEE